MILFSKTIGSIHTLNFFSDKERKYYKGFIERFSNFINNSGIPNRNYLVHNLEEVKNSLLNLPIQNSSGVLVNFIGHGNELGIGDNHGFFINWQDILNTFQHINAQDNIILNTSLMCKGNGVFKLSAYVPKPYYAAFGTNTNTNSESYFFTVAVLKCCLRRDDIVVAINDQNDQIKENNSGYEEIEQRTKDLGEVLCPQVITQFSYIIA